MISSRFGWSGRMVVVFVVVVVVVAVFVVFVVFVVVELWILLKTGCVRFGGVG